VSVDREPTAHDCADHAVTSDDGTSFCPVCERRARELEAVEATRGTEA
jgi:uncharacterized Zn finger protein (UPF0148 family)